MGSVSLIQLALLPLIIGYLIQFLVEPGGELTFNELSDEMQDWYNTGEMVKGTVKFLEQNEIFFTFSTEYRM